MPKCVVCGMPFEMDDFMGDNIDSSNVCPDCYYIGDMELDDVDLDDDDFWDDDDDDINTDDLTDDDDLDDEFDDYEDRLDAEEGGYE